jgi:hemerythrin-like domain-containing protein
MEGQGVPELEVVMPKPDDAQANHWGRRTFLSAGGVLGVSLALPLAVAADQQRARGRGPEKKEGEEEDVAPPEDLMREHGVLKRVLLVYEEAIRRIDGKQDLPPDAVRNSATIIRTFIEDYHEKLEEDYLFPRFEKAGRLTDLTKVLRAQHQAGRRLTEQITQLATLQTLRDAKSATTLKEAMRQFVRMYSPHEAREDTVLFPALRQIVSKQEFGALGEDFEKKEHQLFGEGGFEKMVDRVASIEKTLGIYDLAQFTPK